MAEEEGSGTVLVAALAVVLLVLLSLSVLLVHGMVAAARASTGADLAALAAADAARGLRDGEPCAVAREVAEKHAARLEHCALSGAGHSIVTVRVTVSAGSVLPPASAAARAGPP